MVKRSRENTETSSLSTSLTNNNNNNNNNNDNNNNEISKVLYTNRQRVLVLSSRGITARYRHFVEDIKKLIPHHKTDNKLDSKGDIHIINEIAELKSCNQILYLETRKHSDLYMYLGKTPQGPSAKFHVVNIHTMNELKLTGNCMSGSRPLLNFDIKFDSQPHLQVLKSLFIDAFNTPRAHPKSKPFVDRIMSFFILNNNIWIRNYQIVDKTEANVTGSNSGNKNISLVEIGPRFVLIPIRIFNGSLGGATLYQNNSYISPNTERSMIKAGKGNRYKERVEHNEQYKKMKFDIKPNPNPLAISNMYKDINNDENDNDTNN